MKRAILNEYPQVQKMVEVAGKTAHIVYYLNPDTLKPISFEILNSKDLSEEILLEVRKQAKS